MKVYHAMHENSSDISTEDREKMSILKLVDVGKYVKNVGIRDGQFYVLAENDTDEVYLEYKETIDKINVAFKKQVDPRVIMQKTMEFHNKKAMVMQKLMEIPT